MLYLRRAVLVTGSNRGLGKSTVLNLAKKGVDVIVTYHSNAEEVTKVVAQIELIGAKAVALQLDTGNTKTFDKVTFDERNMLPKLLGQVGGRCFQQRILYLNRIIFLKTRDRKGREIE
ncbi:MAG: SDR family NAD(P)-dependent oxidoreductase [Scytonema hyalinum WJT4-NPBG1]|nr:SDR family NAD(P)-dependent oxidoreductase [Scytonema hyalinum WJT4-NPBG1]